MTETEVRKYTESVFEEIKHVDESGNEYWFARELQTVLEYAQWRRFDESIERAKEACVNSGFNINDHFADAGKMVTIGSNATREIDDVKLSRYACYLIVMNGDSRKEVIALGQTYFAVKTRQQESRLLKITQFSRIGDTKAFTVDLEQKRSMSVKDLRKARKFLIIWEARNWLPICLEQLKQMRNFAEIIFKAKRLFQAMFVILQLGYQSVNFASGFVACVCSAVLTYAQVRSVPDFLFSSSLPNFSARFGGFFLAK